MFLVVTGAEALYDDLGHFGRRPIQTAWFYLVLPALLLNYFGQGAFVLADPTAIANPFFLLYPEWALYPMVALATAATVIASQAVITGAYSLTRQAMQLGFLPRIEVRHTSETQSGQIYMPRVNWLLLVGVAAARLHVPVVERAGRGLWHRGVRRHAGDRDPGFIVMWRLWNWPLWAAVALMIPFLVIDLGFVLANAAQDLRRRLGAAAGRRVRWSCIM